MFQFLSISWESDRRQLVTKFRKYLDPVYGRVLVALTQGEHFSETFVGLLESLHFIYDLWN